MPRARSGRSDLEPAAQSCLAARPRFSLWGLATAAGVWSCRELAPPAHPLRGADRQPPRPVLTQSARLSRADSPAARRRRLAGPVRAAQPADRVRPAGRRTIAQDMMREVPRGLLDRAGARLRPQFPGAAAMRRRQHHGHPQAVVAEPLLRAGGPARRDDAAGRQLSQPRQRPRHGITQRDRGGRPAVRRRQGRRRASLDLAVGRPDDGPRSSRCEKVTKDYRGVPAIKRRRLRPAARARSMRCSARTAPASRR